MSLKEALFGIIDNVSLPSLFARKFASTKQLRRPLLAGIERARLQFEQGAKTAPHRWWKLKNDVVALTVKIKGTTFDVNGVATNHIPATRFVDFLTKFRDAVEAGEFDDELRNGGHGEAKVRVPRVKKAVTEAPAKATAPTKAGSPDGAGTAPPTAATASVEDTKRTGPAAKAPAARRKSAPASASKPKAAKTAAAKPAPRRKRASSTAKRSATTTAKAPPEEA